MFFSDQEQDKDAYSHYSYSLYEWVLARAIKQDKELKDIQIEKV